MQSLSRRAVRLMVPMLAVVLFGQGCFGGGTTTSTGPDGGVWKTSDHGVTWTNKRALVQSAKVSAAAANFGIVTMAFDPQDTSTLYAGTVENGLVFSLDGGDSWQPVKGLTAGRVNAVAVDSKNKCTLYVARVNEIYKTETCGRDWNKIFFDPRTDKVFTQLLVDWFNPTILYAGSSEGDIFKSVDAGTSWQAIKRVEGTRITQLVMDPRDSRVVYVGTQGDGLWKTLDAGMTWSQVKKQFGETYSDARRITQIVLDPKVANVVYLVSKYGIMKSDDQGETWKGMNLTAPPGSIVINSFAIDPMDPKKMVFTGVNALAYTSDGGVTWTAKKLPTTQVGSVLLIDPKNTNTIYLGTMPAPKK